MMEFLMLKRLSNASWGQGADILKTPNPTRVRPRVLAASVPSCGDIRLGFSPFREIREFTWEPNPIPVGIHNGNKILKAIIPSCIMYF